jgi:hypothetical protein
MCFGDTGNFHNTAHIYILTDVNELNDVICLLPSCHLLEIIINRNTGVTSHAVSLKLYNGISSNLVLQLGIKGSSINFTLSTTGPIVHNITHSLKIY